MNGAAIALRGPRRRYAVGSVCLRLDGSPLQCGLGRGCGFRFAGFPAPGPVSVVVEVIVWPFGPVRVAWRVTVVPSRVFVESRFQVLPLGPVVVPWRVTVLPSFVQVASWVAVLPFGPVTVPCRVTVFPSR